MSEIVSVSKLTKKYDGVIILDNLDVSVKVGDSVAIIGSNGAGKSTLFKILLGLLHYDCGSVYVFNNNVSGLNDENKSKIGYISDDNKLPEWVPIFEICSLYSDLYNNWNQGEFNLYMEYLNIDTNKKVYQLSKGEKRLVELGLVLSYHPELIILDEPLDGLDVIMRIQIIEILNELNRNKKITYLFATHNMDEVEMIANKMIIIKKGKIIKEAPVGGKDAMETFRRAYGLENSKDIFEK